MTPVNPDQVTLIDQDHVTLVDDRSFLVHVNVSNYE